MLSTSQWAIFQLISLYLQSVLLVLSSAVSNLAFNIITEFNGNLHSFSCRRSTQSSSKSVWSFFFFFTVSCFLLCHQASRLFFVKAKIVYFKKCILVLDQESNSILVFLLALLLMLVNFFIAFVISDCELIPLETFSVGILISLCRSGTLLEKTCICLCLPPGRQPNWEHFKLNA